MQHYAHWGNDGHAEYCQRDLDKPLSLAANRSRGSITTKDGKKYVKRKMDGNEPNSDGARSL